MANTKFPCPNPSCNTNNFSFNTVKLVGHCFSCGYSAGGKRVLEKLKVEQDKYTPRFKVGSTTTLTRPRGAGLEYLASRGVKGNIIDSIGIKWDGSQIYLPIWSPLTGQTSWVRRRIDSKGYYSDGLPGVPYLLGRRNIKGRLNCFLVEGPFSLLTPGLWGAGFALLGSNLDPAIEKWLQQQRFGRLTLWLDPDTTGFHKANGIEARLRQWHPDVVRVHGWLYDFRDPGEYTPTEALQMVWQAKQQGVWCPWKGR